MRRSSQRRDFVEGMTTSHSVRRYTERNRRLIMKDEDYNIIQPSAMMTSMELVHCHHHHLRTALIFLFPWHTNRTVSTWTMEVTP